MTALLKDEIDLALVQSLGRQLLSAAPDEFDLDGFAAKVSEDLGELELKARVNLIADAIHAHLDREYVSALGVVVEVSLKKISPWAAWPLCSFVERHGLDHPAESLASMEQLTQAWSCEFAIRPYLDQHLDLTRTFLRTWATSPNEHVRRLASEGTRPLLPWGPKVDALIDDPCIGLELLARLRHDDSETVRRSVANHLNDLSKANADLVLQTLDGWTSEVPPADQKMVRHALRTLIKNGHSGALKLLGFATDPQISVASFACSPTTIALDTSIELTASIRSTGDTAQSLVIDFVIHHQTARGTTSPKVFKWTMITLAPGQEARLDKRRHVKNMSTRTYYPGIHDVDLQIAGQTLATTSFTITDA